MKIPATGGTPVTSRHWAGTRSTLNQTVSAPNSTMKVNGTARLTPLTMETPTRTTSEASRAASTHSGKIQALRPQPVTWLAATSRSAMNDRVNDATATPITSSRAAPSTVRRLVGSSDQLMRFSCSGLTVGQREFEEAGLLGPGRRRCRRRRVAGQRRGGVGGDGRDGGASSLRQRDEGQGQDESAGERSRGAGDRLQGRVHVTSDAAGSLSGS